MIKGNVAQIEWNDDEQGRVTELTVFDRSKISPYLQAVHERRFMNSHGACVIDWMDGERARSTPEGQFALWASVGFIGEPMLLEILDKLGRIEEAEWARTMADSLRQNLIQLDGGEDDARERWAKPEYPDEMAWDFLDDDDGRLK